MGTKYIDLMAMSQEMDIEVKYITFPDGRTMGHAEWTQADYKAAKERIIRENASTDDKLYVSASPEPWITIGLINSLKPKDVGYLYPNMDGTELSMAPLQYGDTTPEDNFDVQFIIKEEGDKIYINMTADRAEARQIGHHTFEVANLDKVRVPKLPDGKDVYIHAWGMYCVMCRAALTWAQNSRSIWLACHESDYFCGISASPDHSEGDVEKRTWENTLPH
jgi:hypothetical protein